MLDNRLKVIILIAGATAYGVFFGECVKQPLLSFLHDSVGVSIKIANAVFLLGLLVPMAALLGKAKGLGWQKNGDK